VENVNEVEIENIEEAMKLIEKGNKQRYSK
jgi:hypothetical protein